MILILLSVVFFSAGLVIRYRSTVDLFDPLSESLSDPLSEPIWCESLLKNYKSTSLIMKFDDTVGDVKSKLSKLIDCDPNKIHFLSLFKLETNLKDGDDDLFVDKFVMSNMITFIVKEPAVTGLKMFSLYFARELFIVESVPKVDALMANLAPALHHDDLFFLKCGVFYALVGGKRKRLTDFLLQKLDSLQIEIDTPYVFNYFSMIFNPFDKSITKLHEFTTRGDVRKMINRREFRGFDESSSVSFQGFCKCTLLLKRYVYMTTIHKRHSVLFYTFDTFETYKTRVKKLFEYSQEIAIIYSGRELESKEDILKFKYETLDIEISFK